MHYLVYKTTNVITGHFYIGMHKTRNIDDGYIGSGKVLRLAIKKYGIENFKREILFECKSETEMFEKEAELVTDDVCKRPECYNLCPGGRGGFGYLNTSGKSLRTGAVLSEETKEKISKAKRGIPMSEDQKAKLSKIHKGREITWCDKLKKPKSDEHKRKIAEAVKRRHDERRAGMV